MADRQFGERVNSCALDRRKREKESRREAGDRSVKLEGGCSDCEDRVVHTRVIASLVRRFRGVPQLNRWFAAGHRHCAVVRSTTQALAAAQSRGSRPIFTTGASSKPNRVAPNGL